MRHLTSEQLVDLAEGVRTETSMPHLQSCDACRAQLAELRATLSAAGDVDVPEPSPLFWDHFSARVHDAVEAGRSNRPSAFWRWSSWRAVFWRMGPLRPMAPPIVPWRNVPLWVGSLAVVVLAVGMMTRGRVSDAPAARSSIAFVAASPAEAPFLPDDASPSLVADLSSIWDWDAAVEAGSPRILNSPMTA